jgi:hypothetical protein
MFDVGNNVDHACLKVIIPFKHAPTPTSDANEMVGELINPTHVLGKEMVVTSNCDDDEEIDEGLVSSKSEGNFSI